MLHFRLDLFKSAHVRERRPLMQPPGQFVQLHRCADGVRLHASVIQIPDPARHADIPGGLLHEGTEPDALDAAGNQPSAC